MTGIAVRCRQSDRDPGGAAVRVFELESQLRHAGLLHGEITGEFEDQALGGE